MYKEICLYNHCRNIMCIMDHRLQQLNIIIMTPASIHTSF